MYPKCQGRLRPPLAVQLQRRKQQCPLRQCRQQCRNLQRAATLARARAVQPSAARAATAMGALDLRPLVVSAQSCLAGGDLRVSGMLSTTKGQAQARGSSPGELYRHGRTGSRRVGPRTSTKQVRRGQARFVVARWLHLKRHSGVGAK